MNVIADNSRRKKAGKWRWTERLAGGYLLLFLIVAFMLPFTGMVQHPYENLNPGPISQPPFIFSSGLGSNNSSIYWLGTDGTGQDVLANLIYGARTALIVSVPAMVLATIIGVGLGCLAGFWGNSGLRVLVVNLVINVILLLVGLYYIIYIRQVHWLNAFKVGSSKVLLESGIALLTLFSLGVLGWLLAKFFKNFGFKKQITLPIDHVVLRLIEVVGAIPRLLLVMCLVAFVQPSLINVIFLAAFTYWTGIARLVRAELLQIKELPYIEAARVAGMSDVRILLKQALPNALPPVIVAVAFGLGSLISLEATLSYLGIGIPLEEASWGKIIKGILQNSDAWWLVVFPTLTLCFTVLSLQIVAERILKEITPTRQDF
ncbi:ABC transporter permease [Adhaeribacter swui]|uniref:ABC transporter permease n=1 Tax=Adhaeribacter swui TaxID=2086471 RepID=A0A7G7G5Q0_9BACT|nr:ABC transporter permease [Adhaeribacter swui]QNF32484.1 ABC transporter permease [Adhaeribacter swui]